MISLDLSSIPLKLKKENSKTFVFDEVRKKWLILTPEEHIRQLLLYYLIHTLSYPTALISVEKTIKVVGLNKRFDIVIYDRDHKPWMLVECKAPDVQITEQVLRQLLNYQSTIQSKYWVMSNGHQNYCADATDISKIKWLNDLPSFLSS